MKKTFRAFSLQFETVPGAFERNYSRFLTFLNFVQGNSLILLPEVFLTGFYYDDLKSCAAFSRGVLDDILKFSEGLKTALVYTAVEEVNGKFFNCIHVVEEGRLLFSRPKVALFSPNGEDSYFSPGSVDDLKVVETGFGVIAPVICFELRFSEYLLKLFREGAQVFAVSAQWGKARRKHWEVLNIARAVEFQRFLVSSNGTGEMAGFSMVVDPWGRVLSRAGDGEGVISSDVNLSIISQVERKLPMKRL